MIKVIGLNIKVLKKEPFSACMGISGTVVFREDFR